MTDYTLTRAPSGEIVTRLQADDIHQAVELAEREIGTIRSLFSVGAPGRPLGALELIAEDGEFVLEIES